MANLNPNLTSLHLDNCGLINDQVLKEWATSLPNLQRLELYGPFLVTPPAWVTFFRAHSNLEAFLITQSPRFDLPCLNALLSHAGPSLSELRLREIGKLDDDFLMAISEKEGRPWSSLDLSSPVHSCSEDALVNLMAAVGGTLRHLDLSGHVEGVNDSFVKRGLVEYANALTSLSLVECTELSDEGAEQLFAGWLKAGVAALTKIDFSRCHDLGELTLLALLSHSGDLLRELNISGWRTVSLEALAGIPKAAKALERLDVSWCRAVDDFFVKDVLDACVGGHGRGTGIKAIDLWGCNRLTTACPRRWGVNVQGVEAHLH
jgi:DNA repair protein RAD7